MRKDSFATCRVRISSSRSGKFPFMMRRAVTLPKWPIMSRRSGSSTETRRSLVFAYKSRNVIQANERTIKQQRSDQLINFASVAVRALISAIP